MALSLKKGPGKPAKAAAAPAAQAEPEDDIPQSAPQKASWYKRGNATQSAIKKEDKRIEEKFSGMFRFWLEQGDSAAITFVDGNLTEQNILDCFMYREHSLFMNGQWGNNFVCVSEQEPCPICEGGDESSLVGAFTIIDHREYKGKKGTYIDTPKLFIAKRGTLKQLQLLAVKRGGLAGCTFDVSRVSEKAPRVGDVFDFTEKQEIKFLQKKYVKKVHDQQTKKDVVKCVFVPADYEKEIRYLPASELRQLGFGGGNPVGSEKGPKEKASSKVAGELG